MKSPLKNGHRTLALSFSSYLHSKIREIVFFFLNSVTSLVRWKCLSLPHFLTIFRSNPARPQILELDNLESLQQSSFDPSLPTKIFAHGWNSSPRSAYSSRDGKRFDWTSFDWTQIILINSEKLTCLERSAISLQLIGPYWPRVSSIHWLLNGTCHELRSIQGQ
jgi:hypothetical protein